MQNVESPQKVHAKNVPLLGAIVRVIRDVAFSQILVRCQKIVNGE